MTKCIAIITFLIPTCSLIVSVQGCNTSTSTVCDRAVRYMFDKVLWNNASRFPDVIACLSEFGYSGTDMCKSEGCTSVEIGYCPFECKWDINFNKRRTFSNNCLVVGNCTVYKTDFGLAVTCNRTSSDSKDFSTCSTQYCNGKGRCVLTSDYNIGCNCLRDYYGKDCIQVVRAKEMSGQIAVAPLLSFIGGILLVIVVVCMYRLYKKGKLCFCKQKALNEATWDSATNAVTVKLSKRRSTKERSNENNHVRGTGVAHYPTKKTCNSLSGVTQPAQIYTGYDETNMAASGQKSTLFAMPNMFNARPENVYNDRKRRSSNVYETVSDSSISERPYFYQPNDNLQPSQMYNAKGRYKTPDSPNSNDDKADNAGADNYDDKSFYFVLEKPQKELNLSTSGLERKESAKDSDVSGAPYFVLLNHWKKATQENDGNS